MDFQGHITAAYNLVKKEPLVFILGGLVIHLLAALSLGLLAGPLIGGYLLAMLLCLRDNIKPDFNDVFTGLQRVGALFPFFFLILIILTGFMLLVVPGIIFTTWWMYTLPLMADKELALLPAMRQSYDKVKEKGFFMHLVFLFMISVVPALIINFFAAFLPPLAILHVLLPPLQSGCLASLYLEQFCGQAPGTPGYPRELPGH